MGKYAANMIIILTGIIVFAHSAIPHHHHHARVCIETEYCGDCTLSHDKNQPEHNHQHDPKNNLTRCFVTEYIPASSKSVYRLSGSEGSQDKHSSDFSHFIFSENIRISMFYVKVKKNEPDLKPLHSSIAHFTFGLRAPPVV